MPKTIVHQKNLYPSKPFVATNMNRTLRLQNETQASIIWLQAANNLTTMFLFLPVMVN
jgi:hypothetical protein